MKKLLFLALAVSFCGISTASAQQVDITFSTSSTDPNAGNVLNLFDGGSGSLYVWVNNMDVSGNPIDGLDLDILGTGDPMLVADAFIIENPNIIGTINRWNDVGTGTLGSTPGLLVDDANAVSLTPVGIDNGVGPVWHATLDLTATGVGTSDLTFDFGQFGISVVGQSASDVNFGTGQVVVSGGAVPEPSALALVGAMFMGVSLRRRRHA